MADFKVLTINPGSTSTKVALFEGDKELFNVNVNHDSEMLNKFPDPVDQLQFRYDTIESIVKEQGYDLNDVDAFSGRGGSMVACQSGVFVVNDFLAEGVRNHPIRHPAMLGALLAKTFADKYGKKAFTMNSPDTDEMIDVARVTGIDGVYRESRAHTLNQKETGIRMAKTMGLDYNKNNFVIAHLGGGISISAHRAGRMIDTTDAIQGDGPMGPTRCGAIAVKSLLKLLDKGMSLDDVKNLASKTGGFINLAGTNDAYEVYKLGKEGDEYAKLLWDAFVYQVAKCIGAMACALEGKVDGIIITGGIAKNDDLFKDLERMCGFIAPLVRKPGEFEMEALASGAIRVLSGEIEPTPYDGKPFWKGFDELKAKSKIGK